MYYVVYGILYTISLLPLRFLYIFSDLGYFIIYYLLKYRRGIVDKNLLIAFPEKTMLERKAIAKKFYRNFTDNFIEALKLISASQKFIDKHFSADYHIVDYLFEKGLKCQALLSHGFNWELGNAAMGIHCKQDFLVVYLPLQSNLFNRLFIKIRTRTGTKLLSAAKLRTAIFPYRNKVYMLTLLADQTPPGPKHAYWVNFFNRPTPFVTGPESGIKATETAVVFGHFVKRKRGYYHCHFKLEEEDIRVFKKGELTKKYANYTEMAIRENPDNWLWSHRRWKFEWKPEYGNIYD